MTGEGRPQGKSSRTEWGRRKLEPPSWYIEMHQLVSPGTTFPPEGTCLMCAKPWPCPTSLGVPTSRASVIKLMFDTAERWRDDPPDLVGGLEELRGGA